MYLGQNLSNLTSFQAVFVAMVIDTFSSGFEETQTLTMTRLFHYPFVYHSRPRMFFGNCAIL
jgi:hypothetical protein